MSGAPQIAILITGDPVPEVQVARGDFGEIFAALLREDWTGEVNVYDIRDGCFPPVDSSLHGVIITGSAANVPDQEPWMVVAQEWLQVLVAKDVPTFGICFGHQLLAQALGGEVQLNPRGREMSTIEVERSSDGALFDGIEERFEANACHVDTVVALPTGAESLARSDADDHQCIRFSPTCYGVQFHPEFDGEIMRGYVAQRAELLLDEGFDPERLGERASDTPMSGRILQNFVTHLVALRGREV